MLAAYALRGLKAGAVAGLAFGLFVVLVASPLVAVAEERAGHGHADGEHDGAAHEHVDVGPLSVPTAALSTLTNLLGGLGWGVLLGVSFGVAFYLLEPAVPGAGDTPVHLLGAAGLLVVSGAPWLAVPPQPPGVEGLAPTAHGLWYGGAMLTAAVACLAAGGLYRRLSAARDRRVAALVAALPMAALLVLPVASPAAGAANAFTAAYRGVVLAGQVGLWLALTTTFARFHRRGLDRDAPVSAEEPAVAPGD
jgi:hypothetical protein